MAEGLSAGTAFLDLVPRVSPAAAAKGEAEVGGMLNGITSKAAIAGAGIGAALVAGVAAAGIGLFALGSKFDDAFDGIRIQTGKTGDALLGLQDDFKAVLASGPDSFDQVSEAIGRLNQGLGISGGPLQNLAEQVLQLSRLTGTDLAGNLESVTKLFNNFGVKAEDQGGKLDELFRASQATGISVSDLAAAMASSGSVLRTAGFDFEDSAALLATLEKSGVSATSIMGPLSKAIGGAAKEGKTAKDVLKSTFDAIRKAPDATKAAGAAIETFGTKAGPKLAGLIREGKLSYEDLAKAISDGGDTIGAAAGATDDFSQKWDTFKNQVFVKLQPLASRFFDGLNELGAKILPVVADWTGVLIDDFGKLLDFFQRAADAFSSGFSGVGPKEEGILGFFQALGDVFSEIVDDVNLLKGQFLLFYNAVTSGNEGFGSPIEDFGKMLHDTVLPVAKEFFAFLSDNVKPIAIGVAAAIALAVSPVLALAAAAVYAYTHFETFRNVVNAVASFVTGTLVPAFSTAFGFIGEKLGEFIGWAQEVAPKVTEAFGHVVAAVQFAVDQISQTIGRFVAFGQWIWQNFGDTITSIIRGTWETIVATVKFALDFIRGLFEFVLDIINGDWSKAWEDLVGIMESSLEFLKTILSTALDVVKTLFSDAFDFVKGIVTGAFSGIVDQVKSIINSILELWNGIEFHTPDIPGTDFGGQDIKVPQIPLLAKGGTATSAGAAIVGDNGPELLNLPRGATVTPLHGNLAGSAVLDGLGAFSPTLLVTAPDPETAARKAITKMRELQMVER